MPFVSWAFSSILRRSLGEDESPAETERGAVPGRLVIALRLAYVVTETGLGQCSVSSLLWVRAHSTAVATPVFTDRRYVRLIICFGGDSSAIVSLPCFRYYCVYLMIHGDIASTR